MIKVLNYTKNPISFIGQCVGNCYNSDISNQEKNYKRGRKCLLDNHGRTEEYADIVINIQGYSARMIRELGRHIIGTTYTQASTRYINYDNFSYYIPNSIKNSAALIEYNKCMDNIINTYNKLINMGIPKEDVANILPLGMDTTIVLKINVRALKHLFAIRTCNRAYKEFRDFMKELKSELYQLDDEWQWLCDNLFQTQCDILGYCPESNGCGKYNTKQYNIKE